MKILSGVRRKALLAILVFGAFLTWLAATGNETAFYLFPLLVLLPSIILVSETLHAKLARIQKDLRRTEKRIEKTKAQVTVLSRNSKRLETHGRIRGQDETDSFSSSVSEAEKFQNFVGLLDEMMGAPSSELSFSQVVALRQIADETHVESVFIPKGDHNFQLLTDAKEYSDFEELFGEVGRTPGTILLVLKEDEAFLAVGRMTSLVENGRILIASARNRENDYKDMEETLGVLPGYVDVSYLTSVESIRVFYPRTRVEM